ncbi:aminotransferase class I/II-fold pyridoxal phosphate-dependent enzyme [Aquabacterium sp.]|uniref:MocR-like pyridoxine biosynthesis transcription factor PdxR n=1 Tax=Aquabacterium sp. TaxID=1872578 RepID=UPI0025C1F432|nr:aminotransferase class I/II-fold pyridoxal phosphate-dependent enzyme [Aquabacterium sp.]
MSGRSVVIGSSAALSGPLAALGQDLKLGIDAAMAQINARGGVQGRSLQLQMVDDAYQPNRTLDNVRKMAAEGAVLALLSCVGTPNNTAILPVIEDNGLPYVAPLTGASSLRKGSSRNLFHVRASYEAELRKIVSHLATLGINKISVVYQDSAFGKANLETCLQIARELQVEVLGSLPMQIAALHEWLQQAWPGSGEASRPAQPGALILQGVRRAVLEGVLRPGERVPSSRELARELGVARNTVVAIYDQLKSEGMLVAGHGSGTFVCRVDEALAQATAESAPSGGPRSGVAEGGARPLSLSRRGLSYQRHPVHQFWRPQPFCSGQLDLNLFPLSIWNRLQRKHLSQGDASCLEQGEPGGAMALRRAIADHIRTTRGVRCQPEQVILTDGTVESLELVARLLTDPGDVALMENPCYWGASHVLGDHGLRTCSLDVDAEGLPVPQPGQLPAPPRLVYLTPSHQFPMGHVMSLARRLAWLRYAEAHDAILLEDDYDSEFRYVGKPFPSLQGMQDTGRVIYLGTFSKTLYPGIRMAYLVVPEPLAQVFATASSDFYRDGDVVQQRVLADFIREGHYAAHIRSTRREYGLRREALLGALREALGPELADGRLRLSGGAMGMHLTLLLPDAVDDRAISRATAERGVTLMPLSVYCVGAVRSGLILAYAAVPCSQMAPNIALVAPVIRQALAGC